MKTALHVQIIRTIWTKHSRGARAATSRARVPLALPVGVAALRRGQLTVEIYNFGEPNFAMPASFQTELFDLSEHLLFENGAFALNWNGQNATTNWRWTRVGAPTPKIYDERAGQIEVPSDGWIQLRWHGRFSDQDTGKWSYQHTVVNVARCDENFDVDFAGAPSRTFEWLPRLR